MRNIVKWAHFYVSIAQGSGDLYALENNDTILLKDKLYKSSNIDFINGGKTFIQRYYYDISPLRISFTYRKMTPTLSSSDNLTIRVKEHLNNNLRTDTTIIMKSYRKEDIKGTTKYISDLIFK